MQPLRRLLHQNALRNVSSNLPSAAGSSSRRTITRTLTTSPSPFRSRSAPPRSSLSRVLTRTTPRRLYTKPPTPSPTPKRTESPDSSLSISQRLRKLSREYGWSALGVYLALTALDFPFCFIAVRLLGTDRIGHYEHVVIDAVKGAVKWPLGTGAEERMQVETAIAGAVEGKEEAYAEIQGGGKPMGGEKVQVGTATEENWDDHGYKEAEKANKGEGASMLMSNYPLAGLRGSSD